MRSVRVPPFLQRCVAGSVVFAKLAVFWTKNDLRKWEDWVYNQKQKKGRRTARIRAESEKAVKKRAKNGCCTPFDPLVDTETDNYIGAVRE